ncbi:MAG: transglycosylase SLT domain-containing protein [Bacteroidota bacterium]
MTVSLLVATIMSFSNTAYAENTTTAGRISDAEIQQRLTRLDSPVDIRQNAETVRQIKSYVIDAKVATQRIIGRTALYFPVFEHYLSVYRLPEQLKYLPIVESRLQPTVRSHAGATGLWQFTGATARQYHLAVNAQVDERKDPIRATEAAVSYLSQLHNKYRDWALVLAAYNCGPSRVNQAIARAGGKKDYWTIHPYLPTETQNYVPRFIAASYLMKHYQDHGLVPSYPSYQLQVTRTVKVFNRLSFQDIARAANTSIEIIEALNPGYRQAYIPTSLTGHYLILPEAAMQNFNRTKGGQVVAMNFTGASRKHVVQSGDTLESIAKRFKCSVKDIQYWNSMDHDQVYFRQELVLYTGGLGLGNRS